jgi:hypothetical protein
LVVVVMVVVVGEAEEIKLIWTRVTARDETWSRSWLRVLDGLL